MRLQLKTITGFEESADRQSLVLSFEGDEPVTVTTGAAQMDVERDRPWLRGAAGRGAPVAVDAETGQILPATVALEVMWGHDGPDADGRFVVFGPPRPGAMYLVPETDADKALLDTIRSIVAEDQGAVFALRNAAWIEDVQPLDPDTAMRYLGFGGQ
ncbi:MAG: hypothetical protein AB8B85_02570 [Paracoccaceae bacterium]